MKTIKILTTVAGLSLLSMCICACPSQSETKNEIPAKTDIAKAEKSKANQVNKQQPKKGLLKMAKNAIPAPSDVAAAPADAEKTASGLASKVLKPGTGSRKPKATEKVSVHYTGWTTDGKMFDSSVMRGKPAIFPLNRVIPGWTEGLQLMVEGEKRRLWIPEEMAYKGKPGRPAGMLVFDVELIKIVTPQAK